MLIKNSTIQEILIDYPNQIKDTFGPREIEIQELIAKVIGENRAHVLAHPEQRLSTIQFARFKRLFNMRKDLVPPQYLLGETEFADLKFKVTPAVLIPRPETETLIEVAKKFIIENPIRNIVDLGTGSGAIIIALAKQLDNHKDYNFIGTDKSMKALRLARHNAKKNHVMVNFRLRDFISKPNTFLPLTSWVLISNPPYLTEDELKEPSIQKEPRLALYGGQDGLEAYRIILQQVSVLQNKPKAIFFEIGYKQAQAVSELSKKSLDVASIEVTQDFCGKNRVVSIILK